MDGYFVHFFAPENVAPQPKHIIFVLDTSGSMWGSKLEQLQQAMYSILENLREVDYFSLIQFSTNVMVSFL
jgi:inter-alpha-trypsin inhibitor heavy chain H2